MISRRGLFNPFGAGEVRWNWACCEGDWAVKFSVVLLRGGMGSFGNQVVFLKDKYERENLVLSKLNIHGFSILLTPF